MMKKYHQLPLPEEAIIRKIYWIRGEKVMLDNDLAFLYGVTTKVLKQAVRRNSARFPEDFMFLLTKDETDSLRSQFVTLKRGEHSKYLPFAFTEQGVAMLSGVLRSPAAVQVNIAIMRAFAHFRKVLEINSTLAGKIQELENKVTGHDEKIKLIFQVIKELIEKNDKPPIPRKRIGY